jgi:hypothetical protein
MKFDSKMMPLMSKVAPTTLGDAPDCCLFHSNKYIPNGEAPLQTKETKKKKLGTTIRYMATLIVTPVKASSRLQQRAGTIDTEGIEELAVLFSSKVCVSKDEGQHEEKTQVDDSASSNASYDTEDGDDETIVHQAEFTDKLGRFETTDITHKSVTLVKVVRSHRLE